MTAWSGRRSDIAVLLVIGPFALLLAYAATASGPTPYIAVGVATAAVACATALQHLRAREVVLWGILLVAVFNFTPSLLSPIPLNDEPLSNKVVKDAALAVLLLTVLLVPPARSAGSARFSHLLRRFGSAVALLGLIMLADLAMRETPISSFLVSLRYYVVYPLLVFAILRLDLSPREIERLFKGIVVLAAIEGVIGVLNFLNLVGDTYYADYVSLGGQRYSRAIGTLGNPDNFGLFLGLPAMLILFSRSLFERSQRILLLLAILAGMAVTFSKTSALSLGVAALLIPQADLPGRLARLKVAFVFPLSAALVYFAVTGRHASDQSASALLGSRVEAVPESFDRWISSPVTFVFGEGFGSQALLGDSGIVQTLVTDNMLLTLGLEGGAIALMVFAAMLLTAARLMRHCLRNDRTGLVTGLYGFVLFFLVYAAVSVNFRLFPGAMLFWIVVGLSATLARQQPPERSVTSAARAPESAELRRVGPRRPRPVRAG